MILTGNLPETLDWIPKVFGVCDVNWKIHLTAWIFGLFPLALRPLTNRIPITSFHFMDKIDLETRSSKNCVTRWADRGTSEFEKMQEAQSASGVYTVNFDQGEGDADKKEA